jgi:hypothetical protein
VSFNTLSKSIVTEKSYQNKLNIYFDSGIPSTIVLKIILPQPGCHDLVKVKERLVLK